MKNLKVKPAFIISYPEKIAVVLILSDKTAWKMSFFLYSWSTLAIFFKIIPENPLTQSLVKARKFWKYDIQCLLQILRLHLFL